MDTFARLRATIYTPTHCFLDSPAVETVISRKFGLKRIWEGPTPADELRGVDTVAAMADVASRGGLYG
jgi:hypothetical protein